MQKAILILGLLTKRIIEFIFVCTIVLAVGIIVFIVTYSYRTIENTINDFHSEKEIN
jgi:hypothetical protein